jgi:hypothetical protein
MTEKELIRAAKTFKANCDANGDKLSFGDSCKVILLSRIIDKEREEFSPKELELVLKLVQNPKKAWYRFF